MQNQTTVFEVEQYNYCYYPATDDKLDMNLINSKRGKQLKIDLVGLNTTCKKAHHNYQNQKTA